MCRISSCLFRTLVAGLFGLAVPGGTAFAQPGADPLPVIAFWFDFEAPMYAPKLGPNVLALQSTFADSIRSMFESRFRFLRWEKSSSSDTLIVKLRPSGEQNDKNLYLTIKVKARSLLTMFELNSARNKRTDWRVEAITAGWSKILDSLIATKSAEIVDILSQLPIKAEVTLMEDDSTKVKVYLRPGALRLAPRDTAPDFRVRAEQVSRDAVPDSPKTFADLDLSPCLPADTFFECDIDKLKYGGNDYLGRRPAFVSRILLATKSLHIRHYRADSRSVATSALSIQ